MKQERKGRSARALDQSMGQPGFDYESESAFDPTPEEVEEGMSFADGQSYGTEVNPGTPPYRKTIKPGGTTRPPPTPLPIPPPASCGLCTFFKLGAIGVVIWYFLRKG